MNQTEESPEIASAGGTETRTFKLTPAENRRLQADAAANAGGNVSEYIKGRLFPTSQESEREYAELKPILNAAESRSAQTKIMHKYIMRNLTNLSNDLREMVTNCLNAPHSHLFAPISKSLNKLQGTCHTMKEKLEVDSYFFTDKPEQFLRNWNAVAAKEDEEGEEYDD